MKCKKIIAVIVGLMLLSACSNDEISQAEEFSIANDTTATVPVETTTEISTNANPYNYSETDEIVITTDYGSFTIQDIIDKLIGNELFNEDLYKYCNHMKLMDMNNDGMPELIMQSAIFEFSFIYHFNQKGDMIKLYDMQNDDEWFNGYNFIPYLKDGIKYYFADFWGGGSQGGNGGISKIWMEDDEITTEIIAVTSYKKILNTYTEYEYQYSFGNQENLTEEEFDVAYQEYLSGYEKADDVIVSVQFINHSYEEKLDILSDLLQDYFKQINDKAEQ